MDKPRRRRYIKILAACSCAIVWAHALSAQDDLDILHGRNQWLHYTDARNALYHHFAGEAFALLEERSKSVAAITSLDEWKERQRWIRKTLDEVAGPFPAKTPLNAKVSGTVEKETFRVEHIVYESQPGFYVTASLFIPKSLKRRDRAPAIIYCSGHAEEGYRSQVYQHVILNLVKKGFLVFAFDPVGQGERLEYYDPATGKSAVGGPTSEHSCPGTQAFISGSSQARYMIWDGIRAVDYLLTRREVDPSRIGITGRSGGGTQSSYIAAFDDRILAAAPECYITSFTRLLQSIGPQDAEQNFFNGIGKGIDHGDLLIVRAPKPALVITTTRDIFSIQGARETAAEVSRVYQAYNSQTHFGMVEDDAPHASTKKNREAMYAFFQKHLNNPGNPVDEEVTPLGREEIQVTASGQVSTSLGGESVFSLNRKETAAIIQARNKSENPDVSAVVTLAKKLSGFREPDKYAAPVFTGRLQRDGYAIEKYFVKGEGDYVIPFLRMVPHEPTGETILYLHPSGKAAQAQPEGEMEALVEKGFSVLAPDLPGIGDMGSGDFKGDAFIGGVSHNIWYSAMLIGRSIAGLHAGDIARLLATVDTTGSNEVYAIARKEMTSSLLHAAAFIPSIKKIALIEPLISYESLVMNRNYHSPFVMGAVPGSLRVYDLPALASSLAPRELFIVNPVNGAGEYIGDEAISEAFQVATAVYNRVKGGGQLAIAHDIRPEKLVNLLTEWSRE